MSSISLSHVILKTGFTSDSMASVPLVEDNLDSSTESGTSQISSDFGEITTDRMASVPLEEDKLDSSTKPGISLSVSLLFSVFNRLKDN